MRKIVPVCLTTVSLTPALGIAMNWVMRGGRLVPRTAPGMLSGGGDAAGTAHITQLYPRAAQVETVRVGLENT